MAVDFPSSPALNDTYTSGGLTWTYDGVKWVAPGAGGVVSSFNTRTGAVTLTNGDVTAVLPPSSTPPLVDGTAAVGTGTTWARGDHVHPTDTSGWLGDSRLINGDFRIDQRHGGSFGNSPSDWAVDRWLFSGVTGGDMSYGRNLNSVTGPPGFPNCLGFQTTSVGTVPVAGAYYCFQPIEGDLVSDFAWGTASAQPVTLSFWARSSLTGQFSGVVGTRIFLNTGATTYPFIYTINVANTWERKTITIPVPPSGTWTLSGNLGAMVVEFALGTGSNYLVPANTWVTQAGAGAALCATGSVHLKNTNNATLYLTGLKLEVGSVATPYNRQSLTKSLADCQRYCLKLGGVRSFDLVVQGYVTAPNPLGITVGYPSSMRATPTVTANGTFALINSTVAFSASPQGIGIQLTPSATGAVSWANASGSAYLILDAEI